MWTVLRTFDIDCGYQVLWLPIAICTSREKAKSIAIDETISRTSHNMPVSVEVDGNKYMVNYDVCNYTYTETISVHEYDDGEVIVDSSDIDSTHAVVKVHDDNVYDEIMPEHWNDLHH